MTPPGREQRGTFVNATLLYSKGLLRPRYVDIVGVTGSIPVASTILLGPSRRGDGCVSLRRRW
jgi:hypothetical protein